MKNVRVALLFFALGAMAHAGENYVTRGSPVFPQPQSDRALIYFAKVGPTVALRDDEVFVDANPIGFLPKNSYTTAFVEPGLRHVWAITYHWFKFRAGKTYLLRADQGVPDWFLDDPAKIRKLVSDHKLAYVTTNEAGLAVLRHTRLGAYWKQRQKSRAIFDNALRQAGQSSAKVLPLDLGNVVYKGKLRWYNWPWLSRRGKLTVNEHMVRWKSRKIIVEIPVEQIQQVAFEKLGTAGVAWTRIRFGPPGAPQDAFLLSAVKTGYVHSHNRKFAAIAEALERSRKP